MVRFGTTEWHAQGTDRIGDSLSCVNPAYRKGYRIQYLKLHKEQEKKSHV